MYLQPNFIKFFFTRIKLSLYNFEYLALGLLQYIDISQYINEFNMVSQYEICIAIYRKCFFLPIKPYFSFNSSLVAIASPEEVYMSQLYPYKRSSNRDVCMYKETVIHLYIFTN